MKKIIDILENTSLLTNLSRENIIENLNNGKFRVISYNKNSVIHFDGEQCKKLEIIISGKVVVDRIDKSGNLLTIAEFYNDDILGGNLLFSINPIYPMTITAQQASQILEIDRELLFELLTENQDFLRTYLEFISDHASILGDKIKHYVKRTIRESVMNYLSYECKKQNTKYIKLNISKKELAERIGVQRTSLSRELNKMKKDGLILYDKDSITILKNQVSFV